MQAQRHVEDRALPSQEPNKSQRRMRWVQLLPTMHLEGLHRQLRPANDKQQLSLGPLRAFQLWTSFHLNTGMTEFSHD